jgi:DNA-binding response OmpR family regulator
MARVWGAGPTLIKYSVLVPPEEGPQLEWMRRPRVMVLEHHRDLRETLAEALLYEGYLVTPAATGSAALEALQGAADDQLPDAVVMDAQDGRDVAAVVAREPRYAEVRVVALRFPLDPPCPADVAVQRPFRLDALLAAVSAALSRPRPPAGSPAAT